MCILQSQEIAVNRFIIIYQLSHPIRMLSVITYLESSDSPYALTSTFCHHLSLWLPCATS